MPVEVAQKDYRDIQKEYDQLFSTEPVRDEDRAYRWFARRFLKELPSMTSLLDIACGGGYFFRQFRAEAGQKVRLTGTDISSQALSLARKESPDSAFGLAVAEYMPFENASFDALSCLGSMEHFLDLERAIPEMCRIVKPEGRVFILVPNIFWYKDIISVLFTGTRKTRNQTHERFASWGEWVDVIEKFGLKVLKTEKYNGIARRPFKQRIKDLVIPTRFSYHFLFICRKA